MFANLSPSSGKATLSPFRSAHGREQPRHGLRIVVVDLRRRIDEPIHGRRVAAEVGRQHFDGRGKDSRTEISNSDFGFDSELSASSQTGRTPDPDPDCLDRPHEMLRPAVGQIVAGDAGDDHVFESERASRLGHAAGLVGVGRQRLCPS